jgi:phenylpyruvate tautomerase PptA (4-oxalocrotonate tautomerase family)
MPYIAIQSTQTLLPQQAQQLADGVTDIMVNLLHKLR